MKRINNIKNQIQRIAPAAIFIPVPVLAACIILSLKSYIPAVYSVNAAEKNKDKGIEKQESKTKYVTEEDILSEEISIESISKPLLTDIEENGAYKDGIYFGSGTGYAGKITVKVEIKNGKINTISIVDTKDGDNFIKSASGIINTIIEGQSTSVDTVSGATYSSVGIIEAVRDALKKAVVGNDGLTALEETPALDFEGGDDTTVKPLIDQTTLPDKNKEYKDGTYFGSGTGFAGTIKVRVIIKNGKIRDISIVETSDGKTYIKLASRLLKQIIKKQSTNVDTVSGATYSSGGLIEAVRDALKSAVIENSSSTTETTIKPPDTTQNNTTQSDSETTSGGKDDTTTKPAKETTEKATTSKPQTTKQDESDSSENTGKYKDGTYSAVAVCNPDGSWDFEPYDLALKVTIKNGSIVSITDIKGTGKSYDSYNDWYIKRAAEGTAKYKGVVPNILENGIGDVDTVSGATCSSKAIIAAAKSAVAKGKS